MDLTANEYVDRVDLIRELVDNVKTKQSLD
jgi:hypothetical protein